MINYYDLLEVSRTASVEVVLAAYRALSKKYHPDYNKELDAADKMQQLNAAKEILSDDVKRQRYDNTLASYHPKPDTNWNSKTTTASVGFDPNRSNKLKYKTVLVNGSEVNFKYCYHEYHVYIHFWTTDNETFNKIKDIVKIECCSRWNTDTKFWRCPDPYYYNLLNRFKLDI